MEEKPMERYCIFEKAYEKPTARKMNLKIHPQTLREFAKKCKFIE